MVAAAGPQETPKLEPSLESAVGVATAFAPAAPDGLDPTPPTSSSEMGVAVHAGPEIAPVCSNTAVALALTNVTVPKFVRGSGVQTPLRVQEEGASAIHSADETSGAFMLSFFAKVFLVV